jgi:hypothetical protein
MIRLIFSDKKSPETILRAFCFCETLVYRIIMQTEKSDGSHSRIPPLHPTSHGLRLAGGYGFASEQLINGSFDIFPGRC